MGPTDLPSHPCDVKELVAQAARAATLGAEAKGGEALLIVELPAADECSPALGRLRPAVRDPRDLLAR